MDLNEIDAMLRGARVANFGHGRPGHVALIRKGLVKTVAAHSDTAGKLAQIALSGYYPKGAGHSGLFGYLAIPRKVIMRRSSSTIC